jgi:hypothetical protein
MFYEVFLGHLDVHFGPMLLKAKLRMLFEPPRSDLAFADSTQDRHWRRMVTGISGSLLSQSGEILCEHLCTDAQGPYKDLGQVNGDLSDDRRTDHPHSLGC